MYDPYACHSRYNYRHQKSCNKIPFSICITWQSSVPVVSYVAINCRPGNLLVPLSLLKIGQSWRSAMKMHIDDTGPFVVVKMGIQLYVVMLLQQSSRYLCTFCDSVFICMTDEILHCLIFCDSVFICMTDEILHCLIFCDSVFICMTDEILHCLIFCDSVFICMIDEILHCLIFCDSVFICMIDEILHCLIFCDSVFICMIDEILHCLIFITLKHFHTKLKFIQGEN